MAEYRCDLTRYLTQEPKKVAMYQEFERIYRELEELNHGHYSLLKAGRLRVFSKQQERLLSKVGGP